MFNNSPLNAKLFRVWRRFRHAAHGLHYALLRELSFKVELGAALLVVLVAWWQEVSAVSWALLVVAIATVLAAELMNTAFERLTDLLEPRLSFQVKEVKDLLSAVVLVTAVGAAVVGLIVLFGGLG